MFEAEPGTPCGKEAELRDFSPAFSRGTFTCASSKLKFPRPPCGAFFCSPFTRDGAVLLCSFFCVFARQVFGSYCCSQPRAYIVHERVEPRVGNRRGLSSALIAYIRAEVSTSG